MKFILGTKENMAEFFQEDGTVVPVTIVSVPPVTVTRIFEKSKDGYDSVQVGFGIQKKERITKGAAGAMKGASYKTLKEFRLKPNDKNETKEGDVLDVGIFTPGEKISVASISKGKGFQGVVKRHGFKGKGPIHNVHHALREPGSIGGGGRAGGRVVKGMKMAGRMGADRITVKNLKVVAVDPTTKTMLVKGAVPGNPGGLIEVVGN